MPAIAPGAIFPLTLIQSNMIVQMTKTILFALILVGTVSCTSTEQKSDGDGSTVGTDSITQSQTLENENMATTVTLQGNPFKLTGELPQTGAQAPDFKAAKADLSDVKLSGYKGKRVILNVFPSIDTGVCAQSVRRFNKLASELDNTVVLCISKDLPFASSRFCAAEGLSNVETLSLFRDDDMAKAYGLEIAEGPMRGLMARSVFVLDENGKILYTQLVPEITEEPDYDSALAALK